MNLTSTLKRIDVYLGANEQANIQAAVLELQNVCNSLLIKALHQPEGIPNNKANMMSQNIDKAIQDFLQSASMQSIPRYTQAEVFRQVAGPYCEAYNQLYATGDDSDWASYKRRTYDTLYSALQSKYIELGYK